MQQPSEKGDGALPFRHVASVEPAPAKARWLVESLWAASGVGILGGLPKCLKTWLATELSLAVASGRPALGRFQVPAAGPVLVYAAEDDLPSMRTRFQAVADARQVPLRDAPVYLVDVALLHLDDKAQLRALHRTVEKVRPRLLVLDPFVRIARVDENSAQEVSAVLGSLRALQRQHDLAVLLVHHMRKSPSPHPGQQLRGSSDFAAWSDSALYLVRQGAGGFLLCGEHRGAPAPPSLRVRLDPDPSPHLVLDDAPGADPADGPDSPLQQAVLERLRLAARPVPTNELRDLLKVRKATLLDALHDLAARSLVRHDTLGWCMK